MRTYTYFIILLCCVVSTIYGGSPPECGARIENPNVPIPNDGMASFESTVIALEQDWFFFDFNSTESCGLDVLSVQISFYHECPSELRFEIEHEGLTTVLIDYGHGGCNCPPSPRGDFRIIMRDGDLFSTMLPTEEERSDCYFDTAVFGGSPQFYPSEDQFAFDKYTDTSVLGEWKLIITDNNPLANSGIVRSWGVIPCVKVTDCNVTDTPSISPSGSPSGNPSDSPSKLPSISPSGSPSESPSFNPSLSPSINPSISPSGSPTLFCDYKLERCYDYCINKFEKEKNLNKCFDRCVTYRELCEKGQGPFLDTDFTKF